MSEYWVHCANIDRNAHLNSNFTRGNFKSYVFWDLLFEPWFISSTCCGNLWVFLGQLIGLSRLCLSCDIYDQFTPKSKQIIYRNLLVQQTFEIFGGLAHKINTLILYFWLWLKMSWLVLGYKTACLDKLLF